MLQIQEYQISELEVDAASKFDSSITEILKQKYPNYIQQYGELEFADYLKKQLSFLAVHNITLEENVLALLSLDIEHSLINNDVQGNSHLIEDSEFSQDFRTEAVIKLLSDQPKRQVVRSTEF